MNVEELKVSTFGFLGIVYFDGQFESNLQTLKKKLEKEKGDVKKAMDELNTQLDLIKNEFDLPTKPNTTNSNDNPIPIDNDIDGVYRYVDNSVEAEVTVSGDRWSGKTMIISGFGRDHDLENAQYDNGIVRGKDLFESSGNLKIGFINGKNLTTSLGDQSVTLMKSY